MALLDFIKNRGEQRPAGEQRSQQQKPDNAKQMYTQKDAEDRANAKPIALDQKQEASVKEAGDLFRKGSASPEPGPEAPTPAPTESNTAPQQPMVQASMSQDKTAPALSPSSAQAGGLEKEQGVSVSEAPSPAQTPSPTQGKSPSRNPPSWDR
jgi:hypothetical protein